MARVVIINAHQDAATLEGCRLIAKRVRALVPDVEVDSVHGARTTPADGVGADALVVGPQGTPWWGYDAEALEGARAAIVAAAEGEVPVLGICGGHQLVARAFGGQVGLLGGAAPPRLRAGLKPSYQGLPSEKGVFELAAACDDVLLRGVPSGKFEQSHREEVRRLPRGFKVLMTGGASRVQAMRHQELPVWGVQFHPERQWHKLPAGKRLMENFVRAAGLGADRRR